MRFLTFILLIVIWSMQNTLAQDTLTLAFLAPSDTAKNPLKDEKRVIEKSAWENYDYLVVGKIAIAGNKITKRPIILRELDFKEGDTIRVANLEGRFKKNRNQIYNTTLFNDVALKIEGLKNNLVDVLVEVEERWYIFPAPIFEIADRNFNEWWNTHNRDLRRTQYGGFIEVKNFRGRKEKLKLWAQFGYTQKFDIGYDIPYLDKRRRVGMNVFASYANNREIFYQDSLNKQVFFRVGESFMRTRFKTGFGINFRPDIQHNHNWNVAFYRNTIADTVAIINPDYFLNAQTRQHYTQFSYTFTEDKRDIAVYPKSGHFFRANFTQIGLPLLGDNVNITALYANYTQYMPLGKRWFGVVNTRAKISLPLKQPYYNQQGNMGYGSSYLRGYEYDVISGQAFGLLRTAMRYQLFDKKFRNDLIKIRQLRTIPMAVYLKTYAELGYVHDQYYYEYNPLTNILLGSTGIGVDVLTFYDWFFGLEYSLTLQKKHGLFVSFGLNFD